MLKIIRGINVVEIMADSFVRVPKALNPLGYVRITTIRAWIARIILAELNTHRLFSRNSASSRAIPIEKTIAWVLKHPFIPDRFPRKHSGMQAKDDQWVNAGDPEYPIWVAEWLHLRDKAVEDARRLQEMGISKQLVNRLLEPFLMHQVIITATEWENFLALRAGSPAQNEIRILAEMILEAMNQSTPIELTPGEWHLPNEREFDEPRLQALFDQSLITSAPIAQDIDELKRMIVVARIARVSYQSIDKDDYEADVALFSRLRDSGHWSPFEHVARAMNSSYEYQAYSHTYQNHIEYGWCGNFRGFKQLRKFYDRSVENRPDARLLPLLISS